MNNVPVIVFEKKREAGRVLSTSGRSVRNIARVAWGVDGQRPLLAFPRNSDFCTPSAHRNLVGEFQRP